jgi:hypothetical protein
VHDFEPAKKAFSGWTRQGRIGSTRILLLKPATYMNESGRVVGAAMRFFKKEPQDVTVFYDELPHYFFEFDILDATGAFWSTARRREHLLGLPIVAVPVLWEGVVDDPRVLPELVAPSLYKSARWRDRLRDAAIAAYEAKSPLLGCTIAMPAGAMAFERGRDHA